MKRIFFVSPLSKEEIAKATLVLTSNMTLEDVPRLRELLAEGIGLSVDKAKVVDHYAGMEDTKKVEEVALTVFSGISLDKKSKLLLLKAAVQKGHSTLAGRVEDRLGFSQYDNEEENNILKEILALVFQQPEAYMVSLLSDLLTQVASRLSLEEIVRLYKKVLPIYIEKGTFYKLVELRLQEMDECQRRQMLQSAFEKKDEKTIEALFSLSSPVLQTTDLIDVLLHWVKKNNPDLLAKYLPNFDALFDQESVRHKLLENYKKSQRCLEESWEEVLAPYMAKFNIEEHHQILHIAANKNHPFILKMSFLRLDEISGISKKTVIKPETWQHCFERSIQHGDDDLTGFLLPCYRAGSSFAMENETEKAWLAWAFFTGCQPILTSRVSPALASEKKTLKPGSVEALQELMEADPRMLNANRMTNQLAIRLIIKNGWLPAFKLLLANSKPLSNAFFKGVTNDLVKFAGSEEVREAFREALTEQQVSWEESNTSAEEKPSFDMDTTQGKLAYWRWLQRQQSRSASAIEDSETGASNNEKEVCSTAATRHFGMGGGGGGGN